MHSSFPRISGQCTSRFHARLAVHATLFAFLLGTVSLNAATNMVTFAGNSKVLQTAVAAAQNGDVILVGPGTYSPISNPNNRTFRIESTDGPLVTIIDGGKAARCALLGNASSSATLSGFTLTNGLAMSAGGGGAYYGTLNNCIVAGNAATGNGIGGGGAMYCTLYNCTVTGNTIAQGNGGGARFCTLYNCTVARNIVSSGNAGGASGCRLYNCTVTGNEERGLGNYGGTQSCTNINTIVWENFVKGATNNFDSSCVFTNSCTFPMPSGGTGNTDQDPMFVGAAGGDFHLQLGSPCIGTGDNSIVAGYPVQTDLEGNLRIWNGTVDMGAYEFDSQPPMAGNSETNVHIDVIVVNFNAIPGTVALEWAFEPVLEHLGIGVNDPIHYTVLYRTNLVLGSWETVDDVPPLMVPRGGGTNDAVKLAVPDNIPASDAMFFEVKAER